MNHLFTLMLKSFLTKIIYFKYFKLNFQKINLDYINWQSQKNMFTKLSKFTCIMKFSKQINQLHVRPDTNNQIAVQKYSLNKIINNNYSMLPQNNYRFSEQKPNKKLTKQQKFKASEQNLMKQAPEEDPTTYDTSSTHAGKIFMAVCLIAMFGGIAYVQYKNKQLQNDVNENISGIVQIQNKKKVIIGGEWSLIDHNGKPISSNDFNQSYYLIYFGFTKCPDICPATLIKLSRVLKLIRKMPENNYLNLKVIFVSCDPERDTPQRLRQYLKNFDEQIIGVSGTSKDDPQLTNCMKSFKIYANRIPMQNGQYSIDHTTITYLMDSDNNYVDHLNPNLSEQEMAKAVVNRILDHDFHKMQKRKSLYSSTKD